MIKVMTPFPHHVEFQASLGEALAMMDEHQILHVPVLDAKTNRIKGIVSRNRIKFALGIHKVDQTQQGLRVSDVCQDSPLMVETTTPAVEVIKTMKEQQLDACLVVKRGKLAGIFTFADALSLLLELLHEKPVTPPDLTA